MVVLNLPMCILKFELKNVQTNKITKNGMVALKIFFRWLQAKKKKNGAKLKFN